MSQSTAVRSVQHPHLHPALWRQLQVALRANVMVIVVVVTRGDRIQLEEEDEAVQASRPSWTFVLRASSVIVASETDSVYVDSFNASFGTLSVTTTDRVSLRFLLLQPHLLQCFRHRLYLSTPARVS